MRLADLIRVLYGPTDDPRVLEFRRVWSNPGPEMLGNLLQLRKAVQPSKFAAGETGQTEFSAAA